MSQPPLRIRRDPRDPATLRVRAPVAVSAAEEPTQATVRVDDAAPFVLAVLNLDAGRLSRDDRDLLGAARRLADDLGGGVVLAACLPDGADLRFKPEQEGADRVVLLAGAGFVNDSAESRVSFILAAAETSGARHLLFSDTNVGGELARRVAARLGDRAAFEVRRLDAQGLAADTDAGRIEVRRPLPRVIVPARASFAPLNETVLREARTVPVSLGPPPRVRDRGLLPFDPGNVPLAEADLIIAAGSGLTDWPSFHAAARALGAAEAGSRVVCDAGLLPRNRQVGASGALVEPRCYLAFGIAGASQHLQGIAAAERVIAVNVDLRAEMVKRADLAIVADAQAVLPALVRRAAERRLGESGGAEASAKKRPGAALPPPSPPRENSWKEDVEWKGQAPSGPPSWLVNPDTDRTSYEPASARDFSDIVVLVSVGKHSVSKRACRAALDARALELALGGGSAVTALHAGPRTDVLREYLGAGADDLVQLETADDADPLPALAAWLRTAQPRLVVAGARAEAGECSGMVPFVLAEQLGFALATNIVAFEIAGETAQLVQALPGGKRRRLEAPLPLMITVDRAGPEPRLSARMRAARGLVQYQPPPPVSVDARASWLTKPSRPRQKRLTAPLGPGQATTATGRREMIEPDPEAAADAILDFLVRDGLLGTQSDPEARS
ncbi:FAD-binding protein [Lichenifustis flavocetrariae]|uniref:FAD-binding protein n=1 Tax=Lichenifustis flavocetrariae TaxID=2949735 RepID=A0AA41Z1G7_9HYPH|nr:FAD-binding protein [Lichenifustis flavocetrariae]MCW6511242.1 FAD-binding protein [Lichenifustis flavocetrariae]